MLFNNAGNGANAASEGKWISGSLPKVLPLSKVEAAAKRERLKVRLAAIA
jgi:hypothetical protein